MKLLFTVFVLFGLVGCSSSNSDFLKENAASRWEKQGFSVVDYEGYVFGLGLPFISYGGAAVWYRLKKIPDNGITYSGYLRRWGDEIHVYGPFATEAISPK